VKGKNPYFFKLGYVGPIIYLSTATAATAAAAAAVATSASTFRTLPQFK
jgi:hypothetical protein